MILVSGLVAEALRGEVEDKEEACRAMLLGTSECGCGIAEGPPTRDGHRIAVSYGEIDWWFVPLSNPQPPGGR